MLLLKDAMIRTKITGVKADAERQRKEFRRTPAFWQDGNAYDLNPYLTGETEARAIRLLNELGLLQGSKKTDEKIRDFNVLVANLLSNPNRPVIVSRNINDWKVTMYQNRTYFTIKAIDRMIETGYIEQKAGFRGQTESRRSRIAATEQFFERFPRVPEDVKYKPVALVVLKDADGKLIEFKPTRETTRIETILKRVNDVNAGAVVLYRKDRVSAYLTAIFHKELWLYGRLHTKGIRHLQGYNGEQRARITIDGQPVVEIDFTALHPNLLYASEGIQYEGDPYSVVDSRPEVRPFLKAILLAMLNAKDFNTARKAAEFWLYRNPDEKRLLEELGISKVAPILHRFQEIHEPIVHHFCKGKETGLRIMNLDSRIALEVVNHFGKQGVPILAVHDSFLVQRQYADELESVMLQYYQTLTKGYTIRVKRTGM